MTGVDPDESDLVSFCCYRPSCDQIATAPLGSATPIYCSPSCASLADDEYLEAKERVEVIRDRLRRSKHWVAAFGRGDPGPSSAPEQAARDAVLRAAGTLQGLEASGGPQTDRERFVAEALSTLVTAVAPLIQE